MGRARNLPTDLLRTFVTLVDLGSYTKAGDALGRTQPAISLQLRRLEEIIGSRLVVQEGRALHLTSEGEVLLSYAREILRLNDEAVAQYRPTSIGGTIRIGLPTDYAVAFLQRVLTEYLHAHPESSLEIRCGLSDVVLEKLKAEELDVVVAMSTDSGSTYLSRSWTETPIWATSATADTHMEDPLPLVAHPAGCEYRNRMVQALDARRRRWRLAFVSPGISGLQNAVLNGLGVTALTKHTMLEGMRALTEEDGFPRLEDIRVGLYYKHARMSEAGLLLVNHLIARLDEAGGPR